MRPLVTSLLALVFLSGLSRAQPSADTDERAARKLVADYMKARNDRDAEAVRRLFTPDADQLVSTGEWRRGLSDLVRGTSASSQKEAGSSSIHVETVRLLDANVAILDGRYRTVSQDGTTREMWTTLILKRVGSDWRIAAIRNMLPAPPHKR